MVSLEHDEQMYERALFNVPYRFIEVFHGSVAEFLSSDQSPTPTVYWLDYDGGLGQTMTQDLGFLGTRMNVGDFLFLTVSAGPVRAALKKNGKERLQWLQEVFDPFGGTLELEDVQDSEFSTAVFKILSAAFTHSFAARKPNRYVSLLKVQYADGTPMLTLGGVLLDEQRESEYLSHLHRDLPFLANLQEGPYELRSLNLTERERTLFDRAATAGRRRSREANQLEKMGFQDEDMHAYRELMRYLPRYVETIV